MIPRLPRQLLLLANIPLNLAHQTNLVLPLHFPHLPHIPCIVLQNPASPEWLNLLLQLNETPMRGQTCPEHQNASINHCVREAHPGSVPWENSLQDGHHTSPAYDSDAHVSDDSVGDLPLKVFGLLAVLVLLKGVGGRVGPDDKFRPEDHLEHLQFPILRRRGHKNNCDLNQYNQYPNLYIPFQILLIIYHSDCLFDIFKGYRITMSSFKSKAQLLKAQLCEQSQEEQQIQIVKECKPNVSTTKQELSLQQPIIIQRKTVVKSQSQTFKKTKQEETYTRKKVEPWAPISVPVREKKMDLENISINTPTTQTNKEIQIQIQKDDKNKDCLKKLFKKVRKLEDDLKQSQKERVRLNLQLQNYRNRTKICSDHEKVIAKLQAENYRLAVDLDMLRRLLKEREEEIQRLNLRAPKEIIKEVIVQKPVEVIVQVPKMIAGPERIVEKIVEIPKYIQVQKKVVVEVVKEVPKEVIKTVNVEVPTIVEKPVYIDKPIYIESPPIEREKIVEVPVRVDVPYEVPVEYPVYIDKPVVEEEWLIKIRELEEHLEYALRDNAFLVTENGNLRLKVSQLSQNLEVLRRHNEEKNREVEILLQNNSIDYVPFSPNQQDYSMGSVKYSISSHPHPRII